jgi:hypothetical protein
MFEEELGNHRKMVLSRIVFKNINREFVLLGLRTLADYPTSLFYNKRIPDVLSWQRSSKMFP